MDELFALPAAAVHTRWASAENPDALPGQGGATGNGRKGRPALLNVPPGTVSVLAHASGTSGCIRRIWLTIGNRAPSFMRGLRLRAFWDDASTPAIDVPLGDFFCNGLGRTATFENEWFSNPEGRSFLCVLPMPFRSAMRIELVNETSDPIRYLFYEVDFTVGDTIAADAGYLHAHWRREASGVLGEDYTILPELRGRGRFLGTCFSVIPNIAAYGKTIWWGEGEVKAFIDGDGTLPTLCGTGVEDYIGTAWCLGRYANRWQGCPIADEERYQFAFYRLHGPDPLWFHARLRLTIQRIGGMACEHAAIIRANRAPFRFIRSSQGAPDEVPTLDLDRPDTWCIGNFERAGDDWASCSWFYLDRPENGLPALAPVAERIAGLG